MRIPVKQETQNRAITARTLLSRYAAVLDQNWSDARKIDAVTLAVAAANAGYALNKGRDLPEVPEVAKRLLGARGAAISANEWKSVGARAFGWIDGRRMPRNRLRLSHRGAEAVFEAYSKSPGASPVPSKAELTRFESLNYAMQAGRFEHETVQYERATPVQAITWVRALRFLTDSREPRTLPEWVAAGAALMRSPTASYRLATGRQKTLGERAGRCANVRCGNFYFWPLARDGVSAPTGLAPRHCSYACKNRRPRRRKA